MKKQRNFLIVTGKDGFKRALHINKILLVKEIEGGTRIYMIEESSFDIKENLEDVLNTINGRRKRHEKKT